MRVRQFIAVVMLLLLGAVALPPVTAYAQGGGVLVVYRTQEELTLLGGLAQACGQPITAVLEEAYTKGLAKEYDRLITVSELPLADCSYPALCVGDGFASNAEVTFETLPRAGVSVAYGSHSQPARLEEEVTLISSFAGSPAGTVTLSMGRTYPFAVAGVSRTYVPYYRGDDLSTVALGGVVQEYLGLSGGDGRMYVMVDEVYPFSDLKMLCALADGFYENAIPFIVRIVPAYDNLAYPAFLRYMQVLRYVQSKGGAIVLHEPLVAVQETEREPLDAKLRRFTEALADHNIVWTEMNRAPYPFTLEEVEGIASADKNFGALPFDTVIVSGLPKTEEELLEMVRRINHKWLSIADYRRTFTNESFSYNEEPIDSEYEYYKEQEQSMVEFFLTANEYLVAMVAVVLLLFGGLLVVGFGLYRKKFYH